MTAADRSEVQGERPASAGDELAAAWRRDRGLVGAAALFGAFVNLLMLTGPVFMLQVYDRVLASRSGATLVALFGLVVFLHAVMGVLDHARGRVLARVAARLGAALDAPVFRAVMRGAATGGEAQPAAGWREIDALQRLIAAPVLLALFDLPWTAAFLALIFAVHPWLGWLALLGGGGITALALLNQGLSRAPARLAAARADAADRSADTFRAEAAALHSLGMVANAMSRWAQLRAGMREAAAGAGDAAGAIAATTRAFRLLLQSGMLALGAWLVLRDDLTAGAMIACSVLLGRALAPVEQAVLQWDLVRQGVAGWRALARLPPAPAEPRRTALPPPTPRLEVEGLTLLPPGRRRAALRMLSFSVAPGQALGVVGPSGAGKSSLAQALTGLWPPAAGRVRLGGVPLDRYGPETLGRLVGYLPQRVTLFEGTIAENIARLDPQPNEAAIVAAARRAGAHHVILDLPDGYDTRITTGHSPLSGGQIQRIGLARALYGDPVLLVLDEPDAHLDSAGVAALSTAIRHATSEGRAVLMTAHRMAAIRDCDMLLVLDAGLRRAFGPRDQVLHEAAAAGGPLPRTAGGAA